VQAFGDRLKTRCADTLNDEGRDYLQRMQEAARRMQILIEDLLSYSRVTTRANPFVSVDLNETSAMCSRTGADGRGDPGNITVEPLPTVDADATQMRQLMQNLIGNALKFRRKDLQPQVKIWSQTITDPKQVKVAKLPSATSASSQDPVLPALCRDNGIGFDEKYVDKIFVVFQRLHGRGVYEAPAWGWPSAARSPCATAARSRPCPNRQRLHFRRAAADPTDKSMTGFWERTARASASGE